MAELRVIDFGRVSALRSQTLWHALAYGVSRGGPLTLSFMRPSRPYVGLGYHRRLVGLADTGDGGVAGWLGGIEEVAAAIIKRVDTARQSVIALVEPGSCFVGTLLELALAADRISMADGAEILLTSMNFGPLPRASGLTRLESRFRTRSDHVAALAERVGEPIAAAEAAELGLLCGEDPLRRA